MTSPTAVNRHSLVGRGQRLEYFTILYNSLEGLISIIAGLVAGSVSLIGFGLDSLIEVTSGAALLWRLHHDLNPSRREHVERITVRIVGWCFVALAAYVAYDSGSTLIRHQTPARSLPGIVLAAVSLVVMPLLARAKRRVARGLGSAAMRADVLVGNPAGRLTSKRDTWLVVGRSRCWPGHGANHCKRRNRRIEAFKVVLRRTGSDARPFAVVCARTCRPVWCRDLFASCAQRLKSFQKPDGFCTA